MSEHSPLQFHGSIPNASRTPRHEVGGIALFEGVLMRSRTGFAIAIRRRDGSILLRQIPYASLLERRKSFGVPMVRGAAALGEMMMIGSRALKYSARHSEDPPPQKPPKRGSRLDAGRMAVVLFGSTLMMALMFVLLPNLVTSLIFGLSSFRDLIGAESYLNETDYPVVYNVIAGVLRILFLVGYIVAISFSGDIRRVFQYHGSEHKAVLALEDGGDVTVSRARRHDTIHPRCGTTLLALIALLTILGFLAADLLLSRFVSGYPSWSLPARKGVQLLAHLAMLPVVVGVGFEVLKYCTQNSKRYICRVILWPGLMFQRLTTRMPDDHQLEVAIVALFGALAIPSWEKRIRSYVVRGLEDDESAPGYIPRSPARPAPSPHEAVMDQPGTGTATPDSL